MPFHKLPSTLFSWCWAPQLLQAQDGYQSTEGGILIPGTAEVDDRPALTHFSTLSPDGEQFSWLWLFLGPRDARQLRLLQSFPNQVAVADAGLLEAALPAPAPGAADPCFIQSFEPDWLRDVLPGSGIDEVWVGFSFQSYVRDRNLRLSAKVYPVEEFTAISAR